MNIFVLDRNPYKVPELLCDQHVNKFILETTQILSLQDRINSGEDMKGIAYLNHPIRKSLDNENTYLWTCHYLKALLNEFYLRHNFKHHAYFNLFICNWNIYTLFGEDYDADKCRFFICRKDIEFYKPNATIDEAVKNYLEYNQWKQTHMKIIPKYSKRIGD